MIMAFDPRILLLMVRPLTIDLGLLGWPIVLLAFAGLVGVAWQRHAVLALFYAVLGAVVVWVFAPVDLMGIAPLMLVWLVLGAGAVLVSYGRAKIRGEMEWQSQPRQFY